MAWYGDEFLAIVEQYGPEALWRMGEIVQAEAASRTPVRRGTLRRSAYLSLPDRTTYQAKKFSRKEAKPPKYAITVAFSAPHAHLIESGRRRRGFIYPKKKRGTKALRIGDRFVSRSRYKRMSSRPFLGPAIDATRETMVRELANVLRGRLEQHLPPAR